MKAKIERIELFHKNCFGCDKHNRFEQIRQFIINERLPLDTLWIKRIETDPEWQEEAKNIGLDLPFLRITTKDGEVENIDYKEWAKKIERKAKRKVKTTSLKKSATKNQSLINEAKEAESRSDAEDKRGIIKCG